jgi:hypothetical protein
MLNSLLDPVERQNSARGDGGGGGTKACRKIKTHTRLKRHKNNWPISASLWGEMREMH